MALYSPNYPQNYANNMNCSYVLELGSDSSAAADAAAAGSSSTAALARVEHMVHVRVLDLQVEASGSSYSPPERLDSNCPWDYLELVPATRVANASNLVYSIPTLVRYSCEYYYGCARKYFTHEMLSASCTSTIFHDYIIITGACAYGLCRQFKCALCARRRAARTLLRTRLERFCARDHFGASAARALRDRLVGRHARLRASRAGRRCVCLV